MPQVSVIVNTYNSACFICETIASIQAQTFSDLEILVVDDGSVDNTINLVSEIKDSRIQIHSYSNAGIAASRNRGIEKSSAEFIAFIDHDDLWHKEKIENQLQVLRENPSAGFVYSYIKTIDELGDLIRSYPAVEDAQNAYAKLLAKNFLHTASNPLFRRDAIVGIGGFDEDIYGADDWDLFIRLAKQAPVAVSPHHEVYYRIVKGSGSAQVTKIEQGCLKVVNKAFKIAPLELQPLQNKSLGIVYQYLCFRTLEEAAQQSSGLQAIRYFNKSYRYSPELWGFPTLSKFFLRAFIIALLPPKLSRVMTIKMRQWFS